MECARLYAMAQPAQQLRQRIRRPPVGFASIATMVPSRGLGFSGEVRPPIHHNVNVRLGMDMRSSTGESRRNSIRSLPGSRRGAG